MIMDELLDEATRDAIIEKQATPETLSQMVEQLYGENTLHAIETFEDIHVVTIFRNGTESTILGIQLQLMYGFYLEQLDAIDAMSEEEIKRSMGIEPVRTPKILGLNGAPIGESQKIYVPEENFKKKYLH